jgi:YHS domain-containing protein
MMTFFVGRAVTLTVLACLALILSSRLPTAAAAGSQCCCGGHNAARGHAAEPQDHGGTKNDPLKQDPARKEVKSDPYLLDTDPVSGKALGPIEKQIIASHEGREVRFSSQENADAFKADPAKYLTALDAKIVQQQMPFYPLDTCVVSGDKLGKDAVDVVYMNRLVRVSSEDHRATLLKEPAKYVAKLEAAVIERQKPSYPVTTCVVSGEKLGGEMGDPVDLVVGNRLVRFCCKSCIKQFSKDPLKYLSTFDADAKEKSDREKGGKKQTATYTCPMHPDVVKDKPGPCPKCGMDLVKMKGPEPSSSIP